MMDRVSVWEHLMTALRFIPEVWIEQLLGEDCKARFLLEQQAEEIRPVCDSGVNAGAECVARQPRRPIEDGVACDRSQDRGADPSWELQGGERVDPSKQRCEAAPALDVGVDVDTAKSV